MGKSFFLPLDAIGKERVRVVLFGRLYFIGDVIQGANPEVITVFQPDGMTLHDYRPLL
jgi:hypothetical protein